MAHSPTAIDPVPRPQGFPLTRISLLGALEEADPARSRNAWDELLRAYWQPIRRYICRRWHESPEAAEDLTQSFLARAIERQTFAAFDPRQARFRTFLRLCLDRDLANVREAAARQKRGGGETHLTLDAPAIASHPVLRTAIDDDPEELFHREWLRAIFETAMERLRASASLSGREVRFALFERYELGRSSTGGPGERPTYDELALEFAIPRTQVTNHLAWARQELRRLVLEELRRHTASPAEFRDEARRALGVEVT
ncbi:MAG: sigma-70 family RNA polymerase sigma factor [Thermoanaerobaculia bacterium]